jgi:hypothetical protein
VASKTSDVAGDGTTTATVLAQAFYREGAKMVAAGANPMDLKRGIERAVEAIIADLKTRSKPVKGHMIAQVGTISANNDDTIGKIIAEAMEKVGKDGVITVDEGKSLATEVEWVEGMQFDRGYLSAYFITNADKMEAELEEPLILLFEKKLTSLQPLLPVLEAVPAWEGGEGDGRDRATRRRIELQIGVAFDLVAERTQTDYKRIADNVHQSAYRLVLRNHKTEAVTVEVVEPTGGDWQVLESSLPARKKSVSALEFDVPVRFHKDAVGHLKVEIAAE